MSDPDQGEPRRANVLAVDDEPGVLDLVFRIVNEAGHVCTIAGDAKTARRMLSTDSFDVALVDVNLGDESGLSLVQEILDVHPQTAVIMVTGEDDPAIAELALQAGAYGYVIKPFWRTELVIALANALRRRALEAENLDHRRRLEARVAERTAQLEAALDDLLRAEAQLTVASQSTIEALARAIEHRDIETGHHIERMARYSELLAERAGLSASESSLIRLASPMHDVGKITVPDGILFKPGPLSAEEFAVVKGHAAAGRRILGKSDVPLLALAAVIAETHHERWDGDGYPAELQGETVPIAGRIASVADVFDALVSRRVYKPAFPVEQAVDMIREGRGSQFDPDLVDLFCGSLDEVLAIRAEYAD